MGLFGTKAAKRSGRVLKASGMRMTTGSVDTIRALAATRQDWQSDAWRYRDMIGELRFALQFRARAVARVKYFAAQVMPEEDEPLPLNADKGITVSSALAKAAQEELARLPLDAGYQFLGLLDENFGVAGEAWLHGYLKDGEERWEIHSVDEVQPGSDGRISIRQFNSASLVPVGDDEEMLRLWVPHPRFKMLADSPMCSLMTVCEEIVLAGREMRAASRSRFASNGILLVPDGLTLLNALKEDTSLVDDSEFMADLTATLLAPIANEGDPGAVVPAVISGNVEDLKEIRHLRMEREESTKLLEKIDHGLSRLARGMDIQPEVMTGMAAANHWTGWLIDSSTYRYSIDPAVRIVADSFTQGFLRPALVERGFAAADVAKVQVWYDAGNITENPNRGQDAKDAYDRGAIGFAPLRQALGFSDADAPSDEEVLRMVSMKIGIDTSTSAALLQALFGKDQPVVVPSQQPREIEQRQPPEPPKDETVTGPGQTPPSSPAQATPGAQSAGAQRLLSFLIADAAPEVDGIVDERHGRQLMDIDRAERDRLIQAADAVLARALEKAGAKIRSKAQKDKALAASLSTVDVLHIGSAVGRQGVLALGLSEQDLLGDALDALEGKFSKWVEGAIERTIDVVLSLLRLKKGTPRADKIEKRLRDGMSGRVGAGWAMFRAGLLRLAERYLYEPTPEQEPGEAPDSIVPPALVRGSLAIVGGMSPDAAGMDEDGQVVGDTDRPLGGIALGDEVTSLLEDEGVEELGFEWAYGITAERHFEPHRELDGQRFTSWADPKLRTTERWAWVGPIFQPGDHKGCMCDYVPAYFIPEYSQVAAENAEETANARADRELAEMDDAAGRRGTTAQQARDERQRILAHQKRYIDAGKAAA